MDDDSTLQRATPAPRRAEFPAWLETSDLPLGYEAAYPGTWLPLAAAEPDPE